MATNSLKKAREMRNAIDQIEGALMGAGELIDLPARFEGARDDLQLTPKMTLGQIRRIARALSECTRIINSPEYDAYVVAHE
jgi:hypothetical protein